MNRELCLVICFFVGVLVFYLLKHSCGCNTVVEGISDMEFLKNAFELKYTLKPVKKFLGVKDAL